MTLFPLCNIHTQTFCPPTPSCSGIGFSLPFLSLPTLHLKIKIYFSWGLFCTICSVTGKQIWLFVLYKKLWLNRGMVRFVSSPWFSMAEILSAIADLGEKGWGAQLALPPQEAGSFSYRGGAIGKVEWKLCWGRKFLQLDSLTAPPSTSSSWCLFICLCLGYGEDTPLSWFALASYCKPMQ